MRNDVYQIVTDRIIALLESGTVPWRKPWKGGEPPQNLISRKPYRGVNSFLLSATQYDSPFWLSFRQVSGIGAMVRKGEKAWPVVFWKMLDRNSDEQETKGKIPFLRYFSVFNVEQCEKVNPEFLPKPQEQAFEPVESCERLVANMPKPPKIVHGKGMAVYCPAKDTVTVPKADSFDSPEFYYNTLFHELTHATGHSSRLNRPGITELIRFGSDPYSREELIAEMGAAFLCGHCGIEKRTIEESAGYIQNWLSVLKDDRKLVVHAATQAQKACDFVRGVEHGTNGGHPD